MYVLNLFMYVFKNVYIVQETRVSWLLIRPNYKIHIPPPPLQPLPSPFPLLILLLSKLTLVHWQLGKYSNIFFPIHSKLLRLVFNIQESHGKPKHICTSSNSFSRRFTLNQNTSVHLVVVLVVISRWTKTHLYI